jgi:enoyl-CoA hydratase
MFGCGDVSIESGRLKRVYCDFNDGSEENGYWILFFEGRPLDQCMAEGRLTDGERIILYQDPGDLEIAAVLKWGKTDWGDERWVAIADWSTVMDYHNIIVEERGAVTLVTLNRPHALNALNSMVLTELIRAFEHYDASGGQHCLVLTGSEKAFAAGADIKEMADQDFASMYGSNFFQGWEKVTATRKPWIAAVAGYALGGGCEVAMMADFIIAADNAKFGQPEIKLGVTPGMGGSQRLTRAIGKAKAMEMCLTGRMMDAEEAEQAGLVARVVPAADLLAEALKTAEAIAAMAPLAAVATKEMVNAAYEMSLSQGIIFERRLFHGLFGTEDQKEGMAAFVDKRAAEWKGR